MAGSQRWAVPVASPMARPLPSGENATDWGMPAAAAGSFWARCRVVMSQSSTLPSECTAANVRPPGAKATERTGSSSTGNRSNPCRRVGSQRRTVRSRPAVARVLLSGEKVTPQMRP